MKNEAIKMIKTPQSLIRVAVFCLPLVLVASCGGESTTQNNVINFDPVTLGVTSSPPEPPNPPNPTTGLIKQIYRIETRSPTGNAQIGTRMVIDSAGTLYEGHPTIDLTTVVCTAAGCFAPGLSPLILPYEATTNSTGTYEVTMILGFGLGADGTATVVEAFSGTGYGKTDVVFTCVDGSVACP